VRLRIHSSIGLRPPCCSLHTIRSILPSDVTPPSTRFPLGQIICVSAPRHRCLCLGPVALLRQHTPPAGLGPP